MPVWKLSGRRRYLKGKSSKVSTVIFGILFTLGGIAGIGYGTMTVLHASRMENWPVAEAIIISSKVRVQTPDSGGSSTYIADIRYRYEVAGTVYTADRVTSANYGTSDSSRAHGQVRKYSSGRKVTVHYNPEDASYAVLDTQWDKIYLIPFAAGAAGVLLGLLMIRNTVRS